MDIVWLEDFEALAGTGNFSRAADLRHVTQPAYSRRIRALERWTGTALFERGRQPVRLTEAGARMRPLFADILRRLREAREEARAIGGAGSALRVAATHALSFSFFPRWLAQLELGREGGPLNLVSDGLAACEAMMLAGKVDFLLYHHHARAGSPLGAPDFVSRLVGRDRLLRVAAPGVDPDAAPLLGYGDGSGLGQIVAAVERSDTRRPAFTSHLAAVLRGMALDRRGVAWLPESLVAPDLAGGALVRSHHGGVELEIRLARPATDLGAAAESLWRAVDLVVES